MERRGFLKGLFGGITSAGVLIAASPAEIEAFASPLVKDAPVILDVPPKVMVEPGEHLYNAKGELVAIVTQITSKMEPEDVTLAGDSQRVYQPGRTLFELQAVCVGIIHWDGHNVRLSGAPHRR